MFSSGEKGWAEYGNRTRLSGLGSPCTTDMLIPQWSRYPDSNRGPTHYECVALPTEPYRRSCGCKDTAKKTNNQILLLFYKGLCVSWWVNELTSRRVDKFMSRRVDELLVKSMSSRVGKWMSCWSSRQVHELTSKRVVGVSWQVYGLTSRWVVGVSWQVHEWAGGWVICSVVNGTLHSPLHLERGWGWGCEGFWTDSSFSFLLSLLSPFWV